MVKYISSKSLQSLQESIRFYERKGFVCVGGLQIILRKILKHSGSDEYYYTYIQKMDISSSAVKEN